MPIEWLLRLFSPRHLPFNEWEERSAVQRDFEQHGELSDAHAAREGVRARSAARKKLGEEQVLAQNAERERERLDSINDDIAHDGSV